MRFLLSSGASFQTRRSCRSSSVSLLLQNAASYGRVCNEAPAHVVAEVPARLERELSGCPQPSNYPGSLAESIRGESQGERSASRGAGWEGDTTMSPWGFQELKVKLQP